SRSAMPGNDEMLAVIDALGLGREVHQVPNRVHTFAQPPDVVEWVEGYYGLDPERRQALADALAPHIEERDGHYGLASPRETLVIIVRRS
ncbi:MAG TPA: hypothetical protein VM283_02265, partial [Armatimonadota bacterium]|nr:hypothetical protein [Armatimonadota bacterium]